MSKIIDLFNESADGLRVEYDERRKVMSYGEYLGQLADKPRHDVRDAARYTLDAIDHFGTEPIDHPFGTNRRYKIFDQEFADPASRLVGQEQAQGNLHAALASQVSDGRVNRLIVIHGPNGSAKSTMVNCLFNGLDHYSRTREGEMFRFRWIFPTRATSTGTIGFGTRLKRDKIETFAHLEDDQIDATLECEVRDHPLLLLPKSARLELIRTALEQAGHGDYQIPEYFLQASLCHRCRQVADSLMRTHRGDMRRVLAHVQVEPWAFSRRYRRGLVQVGPQMSVDASQRQLTADRSLSALPTELQNMTLFETYGPLVDAAGGICEFADMLKRPLDAYKYLLGTIEAGEVMLGQSILRLNTVLLATTNDVMLEAFREHHEYQSFRDRLTLVPVPYIVRHSVERRIYELQLLPHISRHTAPHAVRAAAQWAVLTRLHKPDPEAYPQELRSIVGALGAGEKCALYDSGTIPEELVSAEDNKLLARAIRLISTEDASRWSYEGRYGASPRLIRQVLLTAAQSEEFDCLSPFAVLDELDAVCDRVREHPFLDREAQEGGYHDHRAFIGLVEEQILDDIEDEVQSAAGLVEEGRYDEQLERYVNHVKHAVKGEKLDNPITGASEDPDESMMRGVEELIEVKDGDREEFRSGVISRIAVWAIENKGQQLIVRNVLPDYHKRLRDSYFARNRAKVGEIARHALAVLDGDEPALTAETRATGEALIEALVDKYGYCKSCARDALARLQSRRFADRQGGA